MLPWHVKLGDQVVDQPVVPAICSNDELFELQAVLAGKVLGQLAGVTAAPFVRSGHLVPVLVEHMPNYASYFVYFGSRSSQPVRARAFIDLAVQRLGERSEYVLTERDLQGGRRRGSRARRTATRSR